ncbi:hypothetical protein Sme01_47390 [Sphaerisporangium melleum]|uniref:Phosphotyrosine protein phosphatase I domain-containing protein n=1 Tax=Sphaerisporangium melleum TaxID=321316 RepID=A0A917RQ63_9ACTN|nr:hypothetical protein [Sphaerisporangium melleum]GGL19497.1 hypothetical protein GCM10007964_71920 [Sphaerisporangium melleum]GII72263.1 hypothetical protein Sme01_47390 [Sphaerisporangium melleum]
MSRPGQRTHPLAAQALREPYGIDLADRRPRHLDALRGHRFDYVITLCDRVREVCPEFGDHGRRLHWSTPDPAGQDDPGAFARVAADIDARVRYLLPVLVQTQEARP